MAIELTAVVIGFGILARWMLTLHSENVALRAERNDIRENYDALMLNYRCVCTERDEAVMREADANEANVGLTEELDEWHREAAADRVAIVLTGRRWAN